MFDLAEVLHRPGVSHSLLRLRSFPMQAVRLERGEMLLCFREFGLFVDGSGKKARPDLKWAQVPKQFGKFCLGPWRRKILVSLNSDLSVFDFLTVFF